MKSHAVRVVAETPSISESSPRGNMVALCIAAQHPVLTGRVKVAFETGEERWLPTLAQLAIREGDRVLLCHADNHPEPVVMGVLDGFAARPEKERRARGVLRLKTDERICIEAADGSPVLELFQGPQGPVVRVQSNATAIEIPGKLQFKAKEIAFEATEGRVTVSASDNVVVRGEVIELN